MKKYLFIVCFIFAMLFSVANSFAASEVKIVDPKTKNDTKIEVKSVVKADNTKYVKSKAQIKAEQKAAKVKLKAAEQTARAEEKLKNETAKIQAKEALKQAKADAKIKKQETKKMLKEQKLKEKTDAANAKALAKKQKSQEKAQAKANKKALKEQKKLSKKELKSTVKTEANPSTTPVSNTKKTSEVKIVSPAPETTSATTKKEVVEVIAQPKEVKAIENNNKEEIVENIDTTTPVRIVNSAAENEIKYFFENFARLQNKHNLSELKKLYAETFVNTDGYNKAQLFKLMKNTYESYPDLTTTFDIQQIIANNDFAMVYVKENVKATTKSESKITKDKGLYVSELHNIFYLKKISNVWTIYSEDVVYEISKLAYGMGKGVTASISAPQKVLCGNEYSAAANVNIPKGYDAIGSVNRAQIVDGQNMAGETFRQFKIQDSVLERVMRANDKGNNEAVMVSIGFTKTSQDMFKKAKIDISGLVILMQRVDIIPANSNFKAAKESVSEEE